MRHLAGALMGLFLVSTPALAADLGVKVHEFAPRMMQVMKAAGTDVPLEQPKCTIKGVINCVMEYGSLEIFVDGVEEGNEMAREIVFKSKITTPAYHTLEGIEYTINALRPDLTPLAARRMALRTFENMVVTQGKLFTDVIDTFEVQTSEFEGALVIQIKSADL